MCVLPHLDPDCPHDNAARDYVRSHPRAYPACSDSRQESFEKPACISKGKAAQTGNEAPAIDNVHTEESARFYTADSTSSSVNTFARSSN